MAGIENPYPESGQWLRGTLHTHTTVSDGTRDVSEVIDDYEARGHDFLAISDHDVSVDPADHRAGRGIILLPAIEISENGPHLSALGVTSEVEPIPDRQAVIDTIREHGGQAVLNHPNWQSEFAHWPHDRLTALEDYLGIEIYNAVIRRHPGAALATDRWDRLLSTGRRVWGFANDDSHRGYDVDRAWNVVRVEAATPEAVYDALVAGQFYATTGVTITDVSVSTGTLHVDTAAAAELRLISDHGVVQQQVDGPSASFRLPEQLVHGSDHSYVRVECHGSAGSVAWTQPFFLQE